MLLLVLGFKAWELGKATKLIRSKRNAPLARLQFGREAREFARRKRALHRPPFGRSGGEMAWWKAAEGDGDT